MDKGILAIEVIRLWKLFWFEEERPSRPGDSQSGMLWKERRRKVLVGSA
jgi:hypothetical protein